MKNIKIILAVLTLCLFGGGIYYYWTILEAEKIKLEQAKVAQAVIEQEQAKLIEEQKRLKCLETENYSIVTRDRINTPGQDILVNKKNDNSSCKYNLSEDSFELKSLDPEFYESVVANALVTDLGTGPSGRSFRIYDLVDKKMIAEKKYFGELTIVDSKLSYFGLAKTKADPKNCKDYKAFMKDFGNANLVVEKIVDLNTFLVKETKETKCLAEQ